MIGVFDSGVGGLSVWREIVQLMPSEPILYLADQAHVPYGQRALDDVRTLTTCCARWMIAQGCNMVVIACNTASAAALHHLRRLFPAIPFVGMEPAVKPAVLYTHTGVIGVLATQATFQGELFASVVTRFAAGVHVMEQPCPGWVELVENHHSSTPNCQPPATSGQPPVPNSLIAQYVLPLLDAGADSLVLGCTHFPFLTPAIRAVIAHWAEGRAPSRYEITVIDPSPAVARQVARVKDQLSVTSTDIHNNRSQRQFWTTGDPDRFSAAAACLLPEHGPVQARTVSLAVQS